MGSRGAFVDVNTNNFTFKENGQIYHSIGTLSNDENVHILVKVEGAIKVPEYSHTPNRIYAVVQEGQLKQLAFYGDTNKQHIVVDLQHDHGGVKPHIHYDLIHRKKEPGIPPTEEHLKLVKQIKKEFHLL